MIVRKKIVIEETIANLITEEIYTKSVIDEIVFQRKILKEYIRENPDFGDSLVPINVSDSDPEIVKRMKVSSSKFGVGPMATVAGAIGYYAVKRAVEEGASHIVFDNGGDIIMFLREPILIGIYTGNKKTSKYGIKMETLGEIYSVATSSGKIGHSLSFGKADSVTVLSSDPFLSDAAATSIGNRVKSPENIGEIIEENLVNGVDGIFIVIDEHIGFSENFPEILKVNIDYNLIAKN